MSETKPAIKILGKKVGMTRIFDDQGNLVVCTVICAQPNVVVQLKTQDQDGYTALKLASGHLTSSKRKRLSKPLLKAYEKQGVDPRKVQFESRIDDVSSFSVGQELGVDQFSEGQFIDITGVSKGKGFQGVIKRHNYAGGPGAHGSGFHRHAGSTGMRSTPGRTFPGMTMPGQMGRERVTIQNLKVVKIDADKQVILVKGAIPGYNGSNVWVQQAKKKSK